MKIATKSLLVVALVALLASSAVAANGGKVWRSVTPQQMAKLLQQFGYRADINESDNGRSTISTAAGGINFTVLFYDPLEDGVYEDVLMIAWFGSSYEGTMSDANKWNQDKRHASAFFDPSDDTMALQIDLTFKGGLSEEYIEAYLKMWEYYMQSFAAYLAAAH